MNFPAPRGVFGIFGKKRGSARKRSQENVDANGKIRAINERGAGGIYSGTHAREFAVPTGGAAHGAYTEIGEATQIVWRGGGRAEFNGDGCAVERFASQAAGFGVVGGRKFGAHFEAVLRRELFD